WVSTLHSFTIDPTHGTLLVPPTAVSIPKLPRRLRGQRSQLLQRKKDLSWTSTSIQTL
ncbi:MAG: hypothetical protein M1823_009095, partial [Watsoniomyces obsoletus]